MLAMGNEGVTLSLSVRCENAPRRQGQARVRDLLNANEVIDEIKQHEGSTLTFRVLDLTSCKLIGVSDASLGGVDRFGYPTDQDSKTVKVYSQEEVGIFIGEKPLVSLGARGKFNVLACDSRTITRVCRSIMAAETRDLGLQVDSMQFYADLLILGESAPSPKSLHLKQNAKEWPKTIVTDARDVHDKVSTEKGGLLRQKALTIEIATIREWLVNSGALIRWTADENMIMNGLTKDHKESRQYLARVLQKAEWSVQRDATLVREKSASQSKRTRRLNSTRTSHEEELHNYKLGELTHWSFFFWRWLHSFFGGAGAENTRCGLENLSESAGGAKVFSVLRLGLRERRASRVVGQVRPTVGGIGVGGSRVLESEAETPPLAGAVCVWSKPVLVLDVQERRLRRDVRALGTQERWAFERHCHFQGLARPFLDQGACATPLSSRIFSAQSCFSFF